jgi:hypothetical protein
MVGNDDVGSIFLNVSSNGSGDAIAVWELNVFAAGTLMSNIQATVFPDFNWSGSTITLASATDSNPLGVHSPTVALNGAGDAFATWYKSDSTLPSFDIEVSKYTKTTNTWDAPEIISIQGSVSDVGEVVFPHIAANDSGNFFDAWYIIPPPFMSVLIQASHITLPSIQPPTGITGKQKTNRFPVESERFNLIKWTASPSSTVASYQIFRDGILIVTVPSNVLKYEDHDRPKNVENVYSVYSVTASGVKSTPTTIALP